MLRRSGNKNEKFPTIGILPTGRTNIVGENIYKFTKNSNLDNVRGLAEASISVLRGKTIRKDIIKVEVMENDLPKPKLQPVYAFGTFEWGAFRDAFNARDKYWYFGGLRDYATFIFKAFDSNLNWNCTSQISYTDPCLGCRNCYVKTQDNTLQNRRWWSRIFRPTPKPIAPDYSNRTNPHCAEKTDVECQSSGIIISTENVQADIVDNQELDSPPKLTMKFIKPSTGFSFILDGWKRVNSSKIEIDAEYAARCIDIRPNFESTAESDEDKDENSRLFYIDNESYEVKPIRITLLPRFINFYIP